MPEITEQDIKRIVREELRRFQHNDLMDMPQQGHVNRDHDGRYHRKHNTIYLDIGSAIVFGDPGTNGNFRIVIQDGYLEVQVRDSGAWAYRGRWAL